MTASARAAPVADPSWDYEVVTVSFHSRGQLEQMIAGLPADVPVVVVDNAKGADRVWELVAARPNGRYLDSGGGRGFARAANMGIRSSAYAHVVLGNPDSRPTPRVGEAFAENARPPIRFSRRHTANGARAFYASILRSTPASGGIMGCLSRILAEPSSTL